jgi:hypothetical protein
MRPRLRRGPGAKDPADASGRAPGGPEAEIGRVEAEIGRLFGVLEGLSAQLSELAAGAADGPFRRDDLAVLRPTIFGILSAHRELAAGAGVITAPDVLADAPLWLEWWWTTPAGTPEELRVNLNPAAPDFYDYTTAEWYTAAERTGEPRAVGPYVDHFCTGEYTITLSVPVRLGERFLGVAAADVLVSSLERQVLPALLAAGRPSALTSADGRIIAATSPHWPPGLRVPAEGPATRTPLGSWQLVELTDEGAGLVSP